jgi:hypothetical protein
MPRIVCILGMHASGTSCLAGSLQEAGLWLGEVNIVSDNNAKGNRESKRIYQLHDAILIGSGGSWARPPATVRWSDDHRAERDAIIRSFAEVPVWGFKDPRTLLVVDFWREAIPDLRFVGTFRHPGRVAESLYRSKGGNRDHWVGVWEHYNARMLTLHNEQKFPLISFDLEADPYRRSLAGVIGALGLDATANIEFFESALRHREPPAWLELPDSVTRLYESLRRIALAPPSQTA